MGLVMREPWKIVGIKAMHLALGMMCVGAVARGAETGPLQTGDSVEAVHASLGTPAGSAKIGNKQYLYYPQGQVILIEGQVAQLNLVSHAEKISRLEARLETAQLESQLRQMQFDLRKAEAESRQSVAQAALQEAKAVSAEPPQPRIIRTSRTDPRHLGRQPSVIIIPYRSRLDIYRTPRTYGSTLHRPPCLHNYSHPGRLYRNRLFRAYSARLRLR